MHAHTIMRNCVWCKTS